MSTVKHALIRYQTLDRCFRDRGKHYNFKDLLGACNDSLSRYDPASGGIQRRQLFDDLNFMESDEGWSAPIERIRHGMGKIYRYEDQAFSINNMPLGADQVDQIKAAVSVLSRMSGLPQFDWIRELIPQLESKVGKVKSDKPVISFDSNEFLLGREYLLSIFNAIQNQVVLEVDFETFQFEKSTFRFHPYFLKQYNGRWFSFGFNETTGIDTWNVPLDRIQSLEEVEGDYRSDEIDWEDYFHDIVGVTRNDGEPRELILRCTALRAPYIITKPLHPSQKPPKWLDDGSAEFRIKVIPNLELESLINSFGSDLKVIEPNLLP
jgi:hypothetical protein